MEYFSSTGIGWGDLLVMAIGLVLFYFFLQLAHRLFPKMSFLGRFHLPLQNLVYHATLVFEPLAVLLLGSTFVLINPVFHGLLAAIVMLTAFVPIKNYVCGRIVLFDQTIAVGNQLDIHHAAGRIEVIGRLGLKLRTREGLQFINYAKLLSAGYTVLAGEKISGLYEVEISALDPKSPVVNREFMMDRLATVPYLDWNHQPELLTIPERPGQLLARVMVRERNHLDDLFSLLEEWGYRSEISKK